MIAQLRGTLIEKGLDQVIIEVGGVGYLVSISMQTLQALPQQGQEVTLRTYLQVREDAQQLFGFATDQERRAFELCISVSGVGPRLALATLSGLDPGSLAEAIKRGDVTRLTRIPGIGKKTAERLVVELRDKFDKAGIFGRSAGGTTAAPASAASSRPETRGGVGADVVNALCNLGYRPADAERAAEKAMADNQGAAIEVILRHALKALQRD